MDKLGNDINDIIWIKICGHIKHVAMFSIGLRAANDSAKVNIYTYIENIFGSVSIKNKIG